MKSEIFQKIKIARESLGISQSQAGRESGFKQSGISTMEAGSATYIPNKYLEYLVSKGINLNAIYDTNITMEAFSDLSYGKVKEVVYEPNGPCEFCAQKDKEIVLLKENISDLRTVLHLKPEKTGDLSA